MGMTQYRITLSFTAAALFAQSALLALQETRLPDPAVSQIAVPRNSREWKRLRGHARTPEEFYALSRWCQAQAAQCRKKQASCEEELRAFYAHPPVPPFPKSPPRDQTLRGLIAGYRNQAQRWTEFADAYSRKAKTLAATAQK